MTSKDSAPKSDDRIPCPLDENHSVYAKNLQKHLKVCNARTQELPDYIKTNFNREDCSAEGIAEFALNAIEVTELLPTISIVNKIFLDIVEPTELHRSHASLATEVANTTYGPETLKHIKQAASILGIADELGFLQASTCFIEYGAGKGQLSYFLANAVGGMEDTSVVVIDRASFRHKRDNKIENREMVQRIRADISDLDLASLIATMPTKSKHIVGISKHLCGTATDLALRCMLNGNERKCLTSGFLIALCCHHRSTWNDFIGKDFLTTNGIDEYKFQLITKMTSWSICGTGLSRERRKAMQETTGKVEYAAKEGAGLTRRDKEEIGWKCKRILDHAKRVYLEGNGYKCSLINYVSSSVTLENICLVGEKK